MVTSAVCAWEDGIWPNKLRAHTGGALKNIGCISITNRQRVIVSRHPGSAITGYVHSCIGVHGPGYTRWLELCAAGSKRARLWKVIAGG